MRRRLLNAVAREATFRRCARRQCSELLQPVAAGRGRGLLLTCQVRDAGDDAHVDVGAAHFVGPFGRHNIGGQKSKEQRCNQSLHVISFSVRK